MASPPEATTMLMGKVQSVSGGTGNSVLPFEAILQDTHRKRNCPTQAPGSAFPNFVARPSNRLSVVSSCIDKVSASPSMSHHTQAQMVADVSEYFKPQIQIYTWDSFVHFSHFYVRYTFLFKSLEVSEKSLAVDICME